MTSRTDSAPDLLSPAQAARLLGVSVRTLSRYEADDRIGSQRTPTGHRRFHRADVEALLTTDAA